MRNLLRWLFVVLILVPMANAATYSRPTVSELGLLPPFCTARLGPNNQVTKFQEPFHNTLHYCMGRTFLNRYYAASNRGDAATNLKMASDEFGYLVEHWYPDYPAADIYLHRGIVLSLMKNNAEAIIDLTKALSYDSRLVRAYLTLSDLFDNMKQRAKALEVVTEGLRHVPDSKGLQRRYQELGGKMPYPEPIAVQPKPENRADNPKEMDSGASVATPQAQTSNTSVQESATGKTADKETSTEGAPTKRWCRFCTE